MIKLIVTLLISASVFGAPLPKKDKQMTFDRVVVDGQIGKPEVGIVTGDDDLDLPGLLRLRRNFLDQSINDAGEELK